MRSPTRRALACNSIEDLRGAARRVLPRMVFDYIDGGAQSESTMWENRSALERHRLLPSGPVNVQHRSTAIDLFGATITMPVIVGPTGFAGAFWPQGDLALARAASRFGVPFVVSNSANASLEQIAEASGNGRLWLQLYLPPDRTFPLRLLQKARDLGFEAVEVTVDTALPGRRLRDMANGFTVPFRWNPAKLTSAVRHPGWALRALRQGAPKMALTGADDNVGAKWTTVSDFMRSQINPAVDWNDLKWVRDVWDRRLIVNGLVDPEHMPRALVAGYDGVVVSNHGGRQLDGAVATMDVLEEFVTAAGGKIPVLIDSGFRSGTDILRALALGATAVQVGRPTLYGLSVAGSAGVEHALSIFKAERIPAVEAAWRLSCI